MAKTRLKIADRSDIFLYMTRVENLFINEFLPDAPGDYVKVYLYGLMYAQYDEEIDSLMIARALDMSEGEVEDAWGYWEARGLVRKSEDGSLIEFVRMVEQFYGKSRGQTAVDYEPKPAQAEDELDVNFDDEEVDTFFDFDGEESDEPAKTISRPAPKIEREDPSEDIRRIFAKYQDVTGRTISRKETEKLSDALSIYGIKPEVLLYAIDYCADIGNYSADYIFKVALRWKEDGCEDTEAVEAVLEKHSERNKAYREVFKALGFARLTNPSDREIMDRWFDEMSFSLDEVLEACKAAGGIREPSLRYVNKVLENKMLEKGGVSVPRSGAYSSDSGDTDGVKVSRKVLKDYYEHIREEEEKAYAERIREAVSEIPGMEEIFERESRLGASITNFNPGSGAGSLEQIRSERKEIEESKKSLLRSAGYPADYLERKYRCNICKDTGYTDEGKVCTCCRARADEAYMWIREKQK
jgi:DnaD/phage-associated family protein